VRQAPHAPPPALRLRSRHLPREVRGRKTLCVPARRAVFVEGVGDQLRGPVEIRFAVRLRDLEADARGALGTTGNEKLVASNPPRAGPG